MLETGVYMERNEITPNLAWIPTYIHFLPCMFQFLAYFGDNKTKKHSLQ